MARLLLIIYYVFLMLFGLLSWHFNNNTLTILWITMILFYVISAIFLKKYLFLLLFFVSYSVLFPLSINPYTYYVIQSGVVEKRISYDTGTIFLIRFLDGSTATVLYGEEKQCIGREYEGKVNCRMIISMLEEEQIR